MSTAVLNAVAPGY